MTPELHVAGVLVQARPEELRRVADSIADIENAKVHAVNAEGKLVVTLEATNELGIRKGIEHMQNLLGVLTASLVYQHSESIEAMNEEVTDEAYPSGIH